MSGSLAHTGAPDEVAPVPWQPEQVQSGRDSGEAGTERAASALAKGLAWFSLGLGAAQLLAPERVARLVGVQPTEKTLLLMRLMGAREIAHGMGILNSGRPGAWVGSRVAGDALDMGLLGGALASGPVDKARVIGSMAAVAGTAAADIVDTIGLKDRREPLDLQVPMRVKAAVTIDRSADDLYAWWRDFENLPDIMTHLKSVEAFDDGRSRWTVRAPLGSSASWDAEIVEEDPGRLISWQSLPGSRIDNSGELRFVPAPRDRGTEVHVLLRYSSPVGDVGHALLKLFGDEPTQQVKDDLRRFKQVMETGQVVRSDGAPRGADARLQPRQRPAQPQG